MDSVFLESPDGFKRCPYNPSHTVVAVRFIGHLLKCSKNSGKKFQVCPWHAQHHVVEPADFYDHVKNCIYRTDMGTTLAAPKLKEVDSFQEEPFESSHQDNMTNDQDTDDTGLIAQETSAPTTGIYGDIKEVERGLDAIMDAFSAAPFSKSGNGFAILQKLVETIYEEATMQVK